MENIRLPLMYVDPKFCICKVFDDCMMEPQFAFFDSYFRLVNLILSKCSHDQSNACMVRVNGTLYDLSTFQFKHPGGQSILLEWNGKDATRIFRLANHSQIANNLATKLAVLSDKEIVGKPGFPHYARCYFVDGVDR